MRTHTLPRSTARALAVLFLAASAFATPGRIAQDRWAEPRQRWEEKSEEEKTVLLERYGRFQELDEEERELFLERGRRLIEMKRRFEAETPDEEASFEDELRRRARKHGPRLQSALPRKFLDELRGAADERRPVILERFLRGLRREAAGPLLERLGERMQVDAHERERWWDLSLPTRLRVMRDLQRGLRGGSGSDGRAWERGAPEGGHSSGQTPESWREIDEECLEELRERWERRHRKRPLPGDSPERRGADGRNEPAPRPIRDF